MEATITMPLKEYNELKDRLKNLEENYCTYSVSWNYCNTHISYVKSDVIVDMLVNENKEIREENERLNKKKFLGLF